MPKATKNKGMGIMDAVTALTTLGDEESGSESAGEKASPEKKEETLDTDEKKQGAEEEAPIQAGVQDEEGKVRYIPEHKKPDAALTFPEKLMNMMHYVDQFKDDEKYSIAWIPDGKSFVIRNPEAFTRNVLPKFFKATKFQSFTRKLYRWGFRQVNRGIGPDDPIIFGNEFFCRDDEELMVKMRSVTAAANRRRGDPMSGRKRSLEELDEQRKRILMDRLVAENAAMQGDPRYMAQYAAMQGLRFPPGMPMPPMMMQGYRPGMMPPGMYGMMPPNAQGEGGEQQQQQQGEGGDVPPQAEGGEQQGEGGEQQEEEGGDDDGSKPPTPSSQQGQQQSPQGEQEIINSAVAALRYAA